LDWVHCTSATKKDYSKLIQTVKNRVIAQQWSRDKNFMPLFRKMVMGTREQNKGEVPSTTFLIRPHSVYSPSPGYSAACCREEWRGDRAVALESEGGWGFGAMALKIPRSLLRGASLYDRRVDETSFNL
jgi:hypothetical protein